MQNQLSLTSKQRKRPDRRVLRTRSMLREAFVALLLEKDFDTISIQEITDRANLGRATFYLHYRSKEELLTECIEFLVEDFIQRMQVFPPEKWSFTEIAPLVAVFVYARQQNELYRVLMRGSAGIIASRRLHELIVEHSQQTWQNQLKEIQLLPKLPLDFMSNYFAGSLLALVFWWLESGSTYSEEEMAKMFRQIYLYGQANMLYENQPQLSHQMDS
ncbi:MAG: TetR/AcrR family transcriptional regulator [Anaerolineales bacterium]